MINTPELSIVTPCFNEDLSIEKCVREVAKIMRNELPKVSYEHIFSDNSSTDRTVEILESLISEFPNIRIAVNSRNVGAPKNIYRALKKTSGDAIVPMLPADLQDPPSVIPEMYRLWKSGSLVVFGQRTNRQESFFMRSLRGIYYRMIKKMSQSEIPLNAGDFMLVDRAIVEATLALDDKNPYLRGLVAQMGVKSSFVEYTWAKRENGKSKATPLLLIDTAINGLVSTSRLPARMALLGGFLFSILGILLGIWSLIETLFSSSEVTNGIPTLIVALFFIGGVQLFFLGLIGEYILSIHGQIRPEPPAFDIKMINFEQREK